MDGHIQPGLHHKGKAPESVLFSKRAGKELPQVVQLVSQLRFNAILSTLFQQPVDIGSDIAREATLLLSKSLPARETVVAH